MAQKPYKPDIEYIQKYYSYGSEAKVIEFKPVYKKPKTQLPKPKKDPVTKIFVDPVALCGLMVAVVMLLVMVLGIIQFDLACKENQAVRSCLTQLQDTNVHLNHVYHTGYDLETVEQQALALGMVPVDQVRTIHVNVTVPVAEPEPTWWDDVVWFVTGLFA